MAVGKQRTRKSMAKRVIIKGDSLERNRANHNHRLVPKSKRGKLAARKNAGIAGVDLKAIKRALFI
ncbi:MAG TPA: hypothetical protein PLQ36_04215 [Candidatus Gracilibacteria bacterium]|nr:hypothetical protein [Candidatus Gracilibacteria bacterium]